MNSSFLKQTCLVVVTLGLAAACGPVEGTGPASPADDVGTLHQGLVPDFPCDAGMVGWRFYPVANSSSADVMTMSDKLPRGTPPSTITMKEARCTPNSGIFYTLKAAEECDGQVSCIFRAQCLRGEGMDLRYTCSGVEGEQLATVPNTESGNLLFRFECPVPPPTFRDAATLATSTVACVPAQCGATTKRGPGLACVSDVSRPVMEQGSGYKGRSLEFNVPFRGFERQHVARQLQYGWDKTLDPTKALGVNFADYVDTTGMLFPRGVYAFKGATLKYKPNSTLSTGPRGRVVLYLEDLHYKVNGVGEVIDMRAISSFRCVLHSFELSKYGPGKELANGYREVAIDQERFMVPTDCTAENFLYRHRQIAAAKNNLSTSDLLSIYRPKEIALRAAFDLEGETIFVPFEMSQETACAANPVDWFYNSTYKIHDLAAYYGQRAIDAYTGTDRQSLKFGESNRTELGLTEATLRQTEVKVRALGALRGSVRVDYDWYLAHDKYRYWGTFGMGNFATKMVARTYLVPTTSSGAPVPEPADGYFLLGQKDLLSTDGIGSTVSARYRVTETLRNALLRPGAGLEVNADGKRTVEVLNCVEIHNVYGDMKRSALGPIGVHAYRLETGESKDPYIPPNFSAPPAGCRWSRTPLQFRLDKAIEPLEPLSQDDWAGESEPQAAGDDKVSQEHGSDTERNCGSNDAGLPTCNLATANEQRGEGLGGAQYLTLNTASDLDTGKPYSAGADAELLGYTVLDDEDEQVEGPGRKATLSFTPEWEGLRQWADSNFPEFEWKTGKYAGIMGLGVGWGLKIPVIVGPVQVGMVVFTITMGFSVEVAVTYSSDEAYPCLEQGAACAKVMDAANLKDAITNCYASGGRLGELSSVKEAAAVKKALSDGSVSRAWLGAQVANEYPDPQCISAWEPTRCGANHITRHRWLSTDEDFATSTGFAPAAFDTTQAFGTSGAGIPVPYQGNFQERGVVSDASGALEQATMSDSHPSVCVYEDAVSDWSHSVKGELKLGAAVGFTLAFCTPSDEAGLCLEGSINVVSAAITPSVQYTYHRLLDAQGRTAIRSNVRLGVDWEFKILEGAIDVKLVFGPFALKYNLVTFNGVKLDKDVAGGKLVEVNHPTLGAFK